jgi:hypothetical protein
MTFSNILTLIHEPGTVLLRSSISLIGFLNSPSAPKPGVRLLAPSTVSCHTWNSSPPLHHLRR